MKALLNRILSATIVMAMVCGEVWAQTVRVQLNQNLRLKRAGVLVSETVIPAGSVFEVSVENFKSPKLFPAWRDGQEGKDEFVGGIRLIKAPGFTEDDVSELNSSLDGQGGLFMRKSVIGEAVVVDIVKDGSRMRMETTRPSEVYRRHTPDPREEAMNDEMSRDVIKDVVDQIAQGNKAVKEVGTGGAECRKYQDKWAKAGIPKKALENALQMYEKETKPGGKIKNKRYITIVDFTKHSGQKRMFLLDTKTGAVHSFFTSHGSGHGSVGRSYATRFSGKHNTRLTPPGFHITGKNPFNHRRLKRSLVLHGIEKRNKSSASRGIYIHQAEYASEEFVRSAGYTGRSYGCLTIDPKKVDWFFEKVKGGSLVYNYTGE